jgi:DNA-binding transcriptional LysR family regulator
VIDLDLKLLRYFVAVVDNRGFSAAADSLHVSQPALSQNIRRLEELVGARLINRDTRGITRGESTLTAAGDSLYADSIELLERTARAISHARQFAGGRSHVRLSIGFGTSTPRELTDAALRAGSALDDIAVILEHVPWGEEREHLMTGEVDLVFLQVPHDWTSPDYEFEPVVERGRVAVFPIGHRLAGRPAITLADLRGEPIIDAASDREFWLVIPRPGYPTPPIVRPAARTVEEMLASVSAGRGMAITSTTVAENNGSSALAFVPIDDLEPVQFVIAKARDDSRVHLTEFIEAVRRELAL